MQAIVTLKPFRLLVHSLCAPLAQNLPENWFSGRLHAVLTVPYVPSTLYDLRINPLGFRAKSCQFLDILVSGASNT